ncbi:hypothetical protein [Gordonia sp. ABSL49_1]|uniref:hypothetical protein n=1 Tax=Gordonia sp. ABSL49_1 TaxID=2920941 RepID=UPI001F0DDED9|nr:hypothetical protein [Gordonia sp. ABSL49_1]MCH5644249.1 hypothetical protein [Gordonia sp. ABSL49_1]
MTEPYRLSGGVRQPGDVPQQVAAASFAWLANHDAQIAASERRMATVVLVARLCAVAVTGFAALVLAGAAAASPEGSGGAAIGIFVMTALGMGIVVVGGTFLITAVVKRSAKVGRNASSARMRRLEITYPGWWSCDAYKAHYDTPYMAMRGPR